jgi:hypothetical protein
VIDRLLNRSAFIENQRASTLHKSGIVILDNLAIHKASGRSNAFFEKVPGSCFCRPITHI